MHSFLFCRNFSSAWWLLVCKEQLSLVNLFESVTSANIVEGGYVFAPVCMSFCLSVIKLTQKVVNRFFTKLAVNDHHQNISLQV